MFFFSPDEEPEANNFPKVTQLQNDGGGRRRLEFELR